MTRKPRNAAGNSQKPVPISGLLAVEEWAVGRVKPYPKNPRKISDKAVEKVAASIREFGFRQPLVVDADGVLIVGHTRLKAAQTLDLKRVPVHVWTDASEDQKRAYRIADNRTGEEAAWDSGLLLEEIGALLDFDLPVLGFEEFELRRMGDLNLRGATDEDDTPEPEPDPITKPGDLWLLGDHRLLCGDSTNAGDVARLLDGATPHLMVTDPPYGVNYDPNWRNEADRANGKPYGASAVGLVSNDDRADWREAYALFPGDVAYVWHPPGALQMVFFESLVATGFEIRMQVIWAKPRLVIGRGHYHVQHEPCWYAVRKGAKAHWSGDRKQTTLWEIEHRKSETGHGTQKPVEAMRRPMLNNSQPRDAVYDPFLGSGTSIIAAETTGRRCYGLEIDPLYCDVIIRRWEAFTGLEATLGPDGPTFAAVAAQRATEPAEKAA